MATPRKIPCTVTEIVSHGDGVYTLRLAPDRPLPPFQPGQFLHLAIDPYDPAGFWPDSRAFSIASSPDDLRDLEIAYSVVGRFTRRLEAELAVGKNVWVKLPYGEFVIRQAGAPAPIALLAGGTGITAFIAFLRNLRTFPAAQVHLVYGARRPGLLLYQAELARLAEADPRLSVALLAEHGTCGAGLPVTPGRVDVAHAVAMFADPLAVTYYLSGPPSMIRNLSTALSQRGVSPDRVRIDAWE